MSWLTDEELEDCFDSIGAVTARVSSPRSTYRSGAIAAPRVYSGGAVRSLGSVAMPNAPKVVTLAPGKTITPVQYPGASGGTVSVDVPGPGVNPGAPPATTAPATPVAPTVQPDNSYDSDSSYQPDFSSQGPDAIDQYLADEAYDEDQEFEDEASDFGG